MDGQNSVKFQLEVRWCGRTMVAYSGIHAGSVWIIIKMQMEAFERISDASEPPPHSDAGEVGRNLFSQVRTCSERVIQMGRWELQVVKNVRGSGPPLFSTASTFSTAEGRGSSRSGRQRWTEDS